MDNGFILKKEFSIPFMRISEAPLKGILFEKILNSLIKRKECRGCFKQKWQGKGIISGISQKGSPELEYAFYYEDVIPHLESRINSGDCAVLFDIRTWEKGESRGSFWIVYILDDQGLRLKFTVQFTWQKSGVSGKVLVPRDPDPMKYYRLGKDYRDEVTAGNGPDRELKFEKVKLIFQRE